MSDVSTAVITGFVSAFTMFLAVVAFTGRQIGDLKGDIDTLRTEVRSDIRRLDEKFDRMMFELLHHIRKGGHQPPPQAA
jgi:hypothetical protein